jgi:chorismate lyase/3-hydroxybenzoate synthase
MPGSAATPLDPDATGGTTLTIAFEPAAADGTPDDADVLARLRFRRQPPPPERIPTAPWTVPLPLLAGGAIDEVWRADRPLDGGVAGDFVWRGNADVLFGAIAVADADIEAATDAAYRTLLAALARLGRYRIVRVWNFFSRIHDTRAGIERYGLFCRGRHRALLGRLGDFERSLPAASAIGATGGGLVLHVLATAAGGRQVENPRQVSAFHYPPAYAPRSPSFSRSVLTRAADGRYRLYVSGTASIVGHRSLHPGDLPAQVDETLANLAALLAEAAAAAAAPLAFRLLRVYLRPPAAQAPVLEAIAARLGPHCPAVVLQGDICRADLLVEIEGVAESAAASAAGRR